MNIKLYFPTSAEKSGSPNHHQTFLHEIRCCFEATLDDIAIGALDKIPVDIQTS